LSQDGLTVLKELIQVPSVSANFFNQQVATEIGSPAIWPLPTSPSPRIPGGKQANKNYPVILSGVDLTRILQNQFANGVPLLFRTSESNTLQLK